MMKILIISLIFLRIQGINIIMCKENLFLGNQSWYEYKIDLLRSNADLISSDISIAYSLNNSIPSTNQYFDYFPYISNDDLRCY